MSALEYRKKLGEEVEVLLPHGFKFSRGTLEWKRKTPSGYDVIHMGGKNKYSPYISIQLSFGKVFKEVQKIERMMGCSTFKFHISQDSDFILDYADLPYTGPVQWKVDIDSPRDDLARELAEAIVGLAIPFIDQFPDVASARNELENTEKPWCYSFHWMQLFHLNAALSNVDRFKAWCVNLDSFQKALAEEYVQKYEEMVMNRKNKVKQA